jgi:hypothetical protein
MPCIYKGFYKDLQYLPADWTYTGPMMLYVGDCTELTLNWDLYPKVFPGFSEANVVTFKGENHQLLYKQPKKLAKCWEDFFSQLDTEEARPKL